MNRLSYVTTLIAIVIAVALWAIATWLESDSTWLTSPQAETTEPAVRPDTPVRIDPNAPGCDEAEAELQRKVDAAQYCSTDDDCTLFDYGYPIECLTSVSKSEITMLRREYRRYEQSCDFRVYYDCPTGRMERQAVCRTGRCQVELMSNEVLEEETLDYLGLDPEE